VSDFGPICLYCGKPEGRHLGPRQWCPRYQESMKPLKAFAPRLNVDIRRFIEMPVSAREVNNLNR
jgi:hypothetical protein